MSNTGPARVAQALARETMLGGHPPWAAEPAAGEEGLPPPLGIQELPLAVIVLTPLNPRTTLGDLTELQASLGSATAPWMVQFPAVMERGDGTYELIFGHRRYHAAQAAGWSHLRCVVWPPLTPGQVQRMRLLENSHRQPLNPLEQAAALQVLYALENAAALGCGAAAAALLAAPGAALADKIAPLQRLLADAGWQATRPAVAWPVVLDRHGIEMSPAARKRLLAVLNVEPELRPVIQEQGLSASAVRALGRLPADAQQQVMAAVAAAPPLAAKVRRISRVVGRKGYTVEEALDEARGPGRTAAEASAAPAEGSAIPGPPALGVSPQAQADVTELLDMGNRLAAALARLQREAGDRPITDLPAPWGDYIRTGLALIHQALDPYEGA